MFKLTASLTAAALTLATLSESPSPAVAASRYDPLLATSAGQDTLRNIALFEDQRVTGEGKLFAYLAEGSPTVQVRALEAIGRIQEPADAATVIPLLASKHRAVVREAVFALGQLGNRDAVAPLVKARPGLSPEDLALVAEALGKLGGEEAIACLVELLRDFSGTVRGEAALALARCKDPVAANALLLAVHDPDAGVTWRAIYALEKQEALPRSCEVVSGFLEHDDARVRAFAARTLGKLKCTAAAKPLQKLVDDDDVRVAVNAARALGEIKAKDAVPTLADALMSHKSHHVRAQCAMSLEQIGEKDARPALIQGIIDPSPMVRIHSIRAMAVILGEKSAMFIDQLRHDGQRLVRAEAVACYGRAGLKERRKDLLKIATGDRDPMMRAAAIGSLAAFEDASVAPQIVPLLLDPDFTVAAAAVDAIGRMKYREAVPQLVDAYYTREEREFIDVQLEVVRVVGELAAVEADTMLVQAASHPDVRVRRLAVESLVKMGRPAPELASERSFHEMDFDRSRKKQLGPPLGTKRAVIETRHGDIEVELFGDDAIQTVTSFMTLARSGFYRGLTTHRVVPNFVVQGGDPRGDGNGDAGYTVPAEVSRHRYDTGFLGVADAGKDTGSCQWFITLSPQPHLDGRYTIFGKVTKGMEAAWKMDQGDSFSVKIPE